MKLLRGKTLPALAQAVFEEPQWRQGGYCYLIVPDRFSLEAETELVAHADNGVCFDREVTTFARIVGRLVPDGRALGKEGSVMAVAAAMNRLGGRLQCLSADRAGKAAGEVYATIAQLMASDLEPDDLEVEAEGALGRKLADVRLIYREYLGFLSGGFRDPNAAMFDAIRALGQAEWVRGASFFVLGFDALTRANRRFLRALDAASRGVTVAAVDLDFHFGSPTLYRALMPYAAEIETVSETLDPLADAFFTAMDADAPVPRAYCDAAADGAELYRADSVRAGADFLAERVYAAAREDGLRWRDVAVVAAEPPRLADAFAAFGIPVNYDETQKLALHPLARLCLSALECRTTRFADAAVRRLALNPLSEIGAEEYAVWDNYTLRFGLSHTAHCAPYLAAAADDPDGAERAAAERVRNKLMAAIQGFDVPDNAAVTVYADACRMAVARNAERARVWHKRLARRGETAYVEFGGQAEVALGALLDNLTVVAETTVSAEEFLSILSAGLNAAQLRVTPAYADAVNLFTPDSFGFRRYRRLFWYGADEGSLPARAADCGLITDAEIDALAAIGAAVDPKIEEINARARYRLFATLCLAPGLTVICHGEAAGAHPNCFVRAMIANLGLTMSPVAYATEDDYLSAAACLDARRIAATPARAAEEFLRLYRLAAGRGADAVSPAAAALAAASGAGVPAPRGFTLPRARELFFGRGKTSVSQIERYFQCPYMHFVYYGLRCKDRKVAQVRANDVGTFLHAVAETFAPAPPARREDCAGRAAEIVAELAAKDELFGLDTDTVRLMRARLEREAALLCEKLYDFAAATEFVCAEAEKEFGGKDYPALVVGRAGIRLGGYIDRIDRLANDDRVMIVDYKTGKSGFDLRDVYFGRQLQLFAYMRVLTQNGAKPAAALFFPVNNDYGEEKCCGGWINADSDTVSKLDRNLDCAHCVSRFLPVNFNKVAAKRGEIAYTSSERALDDAAWEAWLGYTEAAAGAAVDEICDGYIAPRPLALGGKLPCAYCSARGACDSDPSARVHNESAKDLRPSAEEEE